MRTIILLLLFSINCKSQSKSDLNHFKLKGNVKTIKEISYEANEKFGEVVKRKQTSYRIEESHFNIYGNLIKIKTYSKEDILINVTNYKNRHTKIGGKSYNEKGVLESRWVRSYRKDGKYISGIGFDSNGNLLGEQINKYNDKGNLTEEIEKGNNIIKTTYKYDSNDNLIEEGYYKNNKLLSKQISKYDKNNNELEWAKYNSDGTLNKKIMYKYDILGNKIERQEWGELGLFKEKNIYTYDLRGNKSTEISEYKDGSFYKEIFKYNENDKVIEKTGYPNGKMGTKWTYKYDRFGNVIESIHYNEENIKRSKWKYEYNNNNEQIMHEYISYDSKGNFDEYTFGSYSKVLYKYKLDNKGNWITKTKYTISSKKDNPEAKSITERMILYF